MDQIFEGFLYGIFGGLCAGIIVLLFKPKRICPECQNKIPHLNLPESMKGFFHGGFVCRFCPHCGCEVDRKGRKVS